MTMLRDGESKVGSCLFVGVSACVVEAGDKVIKSFRLMVHGILFVFLGENMID